MPSYSIKVHACPPGIQSFEDAIAGLASGRKVRPVVTRSEKRARGRYPSKKSQGGLSYESLLERDAWRILDCASLTKRLTARPYVLRLTQGDHIWHYTPDCEIRFDGAGALLEVKSSYFLRREEDRARLRQNVWALRSVGIPLIVVTEDDIRPPGLQDELHDLLLMRPLVTSREPGGVDLEPWDAEQREAAPSAELARRWERAQQSCNQLVHRVMGRDLDALLSRCER